MKDRFDLMQAKQVELAKIISESIINLSPDSTLKITEIENSLLNGIYIDITPPQEEPPMMRMMTLDSLNNYKKGESIKPGNIRLNIKKLIESLPDITASSVGIVLDIPILKVCAALNVWKVLKNIMTIKIEKIHAIVIIALWNNCNNERIITIEQGFNCVNRLCRDLSKEEFNWEDYIQVIEQLEKNSNIKLGDYGIWLCEWVSKKYTR